MDFVEEYLLSVKNNLGNKYINENYLITYMSGNKMPITTFSKKFSSLLKSNGLPPIRFHDLRHSVASYILNASGSIEDISAWLGHRYISIAAKYYAYFSAVKRKDAMYVKNQIAIQFNRYFQTLKCTDLMRGVRDIRQVKTPETV